MTDVADELPVAVLGVDDERIVLVAELYLDDSGTHSASPLITLAGYLFEAAKLREFERASKLLMRRNNVDVFHAKKFRQRIPPFKGWSAARQLGFVEEWMGIAQKTALRGITVSLPKSKYEAHRTAHGKNRNVGVFGQCFNNVLDELMSDVAIWNLIEREGLSVIVELGNKNNSGLGEFFAKVRKVHKLDKELKSFSQVAKDSCRAIQLADFLAYYSRQFAVDYDPIDRKPMSPFLTIAKNKVKTSGMLGDGFTLATPADVWKRPS